MTTPLRTLRLFAVALLLLLAPVSVLAYRLALGADVPTRCPPTGGRRARSTGRCPSER